MTEPVRKTFESAGKVAKSTSGEGLKKQIGPLPLGVWLAIIGGGLVISFYVSSRTAKKKTDETGDASKTPPTALVYTGVGGTGTTTTNPTPVTGGFQTNEQWATAAKQWLIAQGFDGTESSTAVDLYINAQALNQKQNAMIAQVIKGIGPAPQSLPPTTGTPPPSSDPYAAYAAKHINYQTSTTGTPSLVGTIYTKQPGDTIATIAEKAFALAPGDYSGLSFAMNQILNANFLKIPDAKNIPDGTTLYIPVLSSQEFPNFGGKIPLAGWRGVGTDANEWQFITGYVPQSAQMMRVGH